MTNTEELRKELKKIVLPDFIPVSSALTEKWDRVFSELENLIIRKQKEVLTNFCEKQLKENLYKGHQNNIDADNFYTDYQRLFAELTPSGEEQHE